MPTYTARCPSCGDEQDFFARIADRDNTPVCQHDGGATERMLTAAMVPQMGLADHYQIQSGGGKTFYGKHDYLKHLKANGLAPSSDLAGEAEHQRKQHQAKEKQQRKEQVAQIVAHHTN